MLQCKLLHDTSSYAGLAEALRWVARHEDTVGIGEQALRHKPFLWMGT
jgi:hypothetical protein